MSIPLPRGAGGAADGSQPLPSYATRHEPSTFHASPPTNAMSHSQQPAFQQNLQLPGVDMSLLANISLEQLNVIGQLVSSGAIQLQAPHGAAHFTPPVTASFQGSSPNPPTAAYVSASTPSMPAFPQTSAPSQSTVPPFHPAAPATNTMTHQVDIDKEEGEIEEDEIDDAMGIGELAHLPPDGPPKNAPGFMQNSSYTASQDWEAAMQTVKNGKHKMSSPPAYQPLAKRRSSEATVEVKHGLAANFLVTLFASGYGFEDVRSEVTDVEGLRKMYQELGLPVAPRHPPTDFRADRAKRTGTQGLVGIIESAASPLLDQEPKFSVAPGRPSAGIHANGEKPGKAQDVTSAKVNPDAPRRQAVEDRKASASKPVPPAKPSDRSEYLARLQAAKNKKAEVVTTQKPASDSTQRSTPHTQAAVTTTSTTAQPARRGLDPAKNELLRQRLAALQAEQAARQQNTLSLQVSEKSGPISQQSAQATSSESSLSDKDLGSGLADISSRVAAETTHFPADSGSSTQSQHPTVLPGLSIGRSQSQTLLAESPAISPQPLQNSRKRPVAADLNDSPEYSPPTDYARPLGQGTSARTIERMIIDISDDNDSEFEYDASNDESDQPGVKLPIPVISQVIEEAQAEAATKLGVAAVAGSVPTSPGILTPGGSAYEKKMLEIELAKQKIAARMAELQKRSHVKPNGNATPILTDQGALVPDQASHSHAAKADQNSLDENELRRKTTPLPGISAPFNASTVPTQDNSVDTAMADRDAADDIDDDDDYDSIYQTGPETLPSQVEGFAAALPTPTTRLPANDATLPALDGPFEGETGLVKGDAYDESRRTLKPDNDDSAYQPNQESDMDDYDFYGTESAEHKQGGDAVQRAPSVPDERDESDDADMSITEPPYSDTTESSDDDETGSPVVIERDTANDAPNTSYALHTSRVINDGMINDVDAAPGTQVAADQQLATSSKDDGRPTTRYKPYESPLTRFRDYRFNPGYLDAVPGGFTSLTYSNKIRPLDPLCPREAAGAECDDRQCDFQHFATIKLTDAELLHELGVKNPPVQSAEEEERWRAGLTAIISELRRNRVNNEISAIAARIAEYRREFVANKNSLQELRRFGPGSTKPTVV